MSFPEFREPLRVKYGYSLEFENAAGTSYTKGMNIDASGNITLPSVITCTGGLVVKNGAAVPTITSGSGAPSGSAPQGSIYLRTDGSSTSTRLYVNTNGSTTWTNFTSAA